MDLEQLFDSITGYDTVLNQYGFSEHGSGDLPWSHRFVHEDGSYVERNAGKWELRDSQGDLIDEGRKHDELAVAFKLIYG